MANITPTSQYIEKQYTKTYPGGWDDPYTDPENPETTIVRPPITTDAMNSISDGLDNIDNYLLASAPVYINWEVNQSGQTIVVKSVGHTYVVLTFGESVYGYNSASDLFVTSPSGQTITYEGGVPNFETNSVYELSFLNLNCIWKKRG